MQLTPLSENEPLKAELAALFNHSAGASFEFHSATAPRRVGSAPPVSLEFTAASPIPVLSKGYAGMGPAQDGSAELGLAVNEQDLKLRSDPAYVQYYYANKNINPRLPPPILSWDQDQSLKQLMIAAQAELGRTDLTAPEGSVLAGVDHPGTPGLPSAEETVNVAMSRAFAASPMPNPSALTDQEIQTIVSLSGGATSAAEVAAVTADPVGYISGTSSPAPPAFANLDPHHAHHPGHGGHRGAHGGHQGYDDGPYRDPRGFTGRRGAPLGSVRSQPQHAPYRSDPPHPHALAHPHAMGPAAPYYAPVGMVGLSPGYVAHPQGPAPYGYMVPVQPAPHGMYHVGTPPGHSHMGMYHQMRPQRQPEPYPQQHEAPSSSVAAYAESLEPYFQSLGFDPKASAFAARAMANMVMNPSGSADQQPPFAGAPSSVAQRERDPPGSNSGQAFSSHANPSLPPEVMQAAFQAAVNASREFLHSYHHQQQQQQQHMASAPPSGAGGSWGAQPSYGQPPPSASRSDARRDSDSQSMGRRGPPPTGSRRSGVNFSTQDVDAGSPRRGGGNLRRNEGYGDGDDRDLYRRPRQSDSNPPASSSRGNAQYAQGFQGRDQGRDHLRSERDSRGFREERKSSSSAASGAAIAAANAAAGATTSLKIPDDLKLRDLTGKVPTFARDQNGSRFLQQQVEVASPEDASWLLFEIESCAYDLTMDMFGNYVIQKLLEHGPKDVRVKIFELIKTKVLDLSLQMYGCRVVQKAIEVLDDAQRAEIAAELESNVLRCVKDQNGNHVVQKVVECVRCPQVDVMIDEIAEQVIATSLHAFGCRVVQRILENCSYHASYADITDTVVSGAVELAKSQFGNYVIQHVIQHGTDSEKCRAMDLLAPHILELCQQKFASNVVEKALEFGPTSARTTVVEALLNTQEDGTNGPVEPLVALSRDQFGNYCVQRILQVCNAEERFRLVVRLQQNLPELKKGSNYAKQIVSRLEALVFEGDEEPSQSLSLDRWLSLAPPSEKKMTSPGQEKAGRGGGGGRGRGFGRFGPR